MIGPMLVGPGCFLLLAALVLLFDPGAVTGGPARRDPRAVRRPRPSPEPARSTGRQDAGSLRHR